jgi:hypothetical protein
VSAEAAAELARWEQSKPSSIRMSPAIGACDFDQSRDTVRRSEWRSVARAHLGSRLPSSSAVFFLLPSDQVVAWSEEIEAAGTALIVTPRPEYGDDGWEADFVAADGAAPVVIELKRNTEGNAYDRTLKDDFAYCQIGHDYETADLAASALGLCTYVYWATDTEEPAAFDVKVLDWSAEKDGSPARSVGRI